MITLRQGKAKSILDNSLDSALTAVEVYNRPRTKFRLENYIVLMVIAWTKLFHAYFQATIGERYFYKEKNGRYKVTDGERKAWELGTCIDEYKKVQQAYKLSAAVEANLRYFIGIRNRIEHRYWDGSTLDVLLFGECQSFLFNYENAIVALFGDEYSLNTCLAYALQFAHLRPSAQQKAQRELLSNDMKNLKAYIDKYKTDLPQTVFDSQEFSVKLLQIPKVSNTNRTDLSIEFVNWNTLDEQDRANYEKVTTIIKDKIVKQSVANADTLKPGAVVTAVKARLGIDFNTAMHSRLWKVFRIRPESSSKAKFETKNKYCLYDEPHDDYVYTSDWIEFIVGLFERYGFTKENFYGKCKGHLSIDDYQ